MKYNKQNFSIELVGIRYGYTWGGSLAYQEIRTIVNRPSLKAMAKYILEPDFESAYLTPDTYIKVTLIKPNRCIIRYFDITLFSSVSQFIGDKDSTDFLGR